MYEFRKGEPVRITSGSRDGEPATYEGRAFLMPGYHRVTTVDGLSLVYAADELEDWELAPIGGTQ